MSTLDDAWWPTGFAWSENGDDRRYMLCNGDNRSSLRGWICYQHPDGQWVTLRRATRKDCDTLFLIADAMGDPATEWIPQIAQALSTK